MAARLPTFSDLLAARRRLGTLACRTPLIEHPALNAVTGARVLLKAENLQRVGAFKFRGAYNKVARTRAFGGEVVAYDRVKEDRDAIARDLCASRRAALIHPFDDPDVIAGQGTAGLEMMEQAEAIGAIPDIVLVGASGGGLIGGVSIAV